MSYRGPICVWCGAEGDHLGINCDERWHEFVPGEYKSLYRGGPAYRPCQHQTPRGHICRKTKGDEIHWNQEHSTPTEE